MPTAAFLHLSPESTVATHTANGSVYLSTPASADSGGSQRPLDHRKSLQKTLCFAIRDHRTLCLCWKIYRVDPGHTPCLLPAFMMKFNHVPTVLWNQWLMITTGEQNSVWSGEGQLMPLVHSHEESSWQADNGRIPKFKKQTTIYFLFLKYK